MIEADFPSNLPAFLDRFGDEDRCRDYLARQKWPEGFRRRSCSGHRAHYLPSRKTFECAACGRQESLIAGTMFEQTKKPPRLWFLAIFHVSVGKGCGRVRLAVIADVRAETLKAFLQAGVAPATTAHTDGWRGYARLERSGYRHVVSTIHDSGADGVAHLPRVHLVFSLLKRWLLGTHHGAVSTKHLAAYLEEYTFRFNRRSAKSITHRFQRVIEQAVMAPPKPYWPDRRSLRPNPPPPESSLKVMETRQ